ELAVGPRSDVLDVSLLVLVVAEQFVVDGPTLVAARAARSLDPRLIGRWGRNLHGSLTDRSGRRGRNRIPRSVLQNFEVLLPLRIPIGALASERLLGVRIVNPAMLLQPMPEQQAALRCLDQPDVDDYPMQPAVRIDREHVRNSLGRVA